jgi:predicted alpha/beta superfamily hydrolase
MMSVLRNISAVLAVIFYLFHSTSAFSQQTAELTLASSALGEDRVVSITLPDEYATGERKYPVLYLLDGKAHEQHGNAAVEFLSRYGEIPRMIVVAVYNVDRIRDFFPVHDDAFPSSGGAASFLEFVGGEVMPYIDKHYRVSGYNVILGHSAGGAFISHALLEKPGLFDGLIAASPYLQYADNHVVKEAATKLRQSYDKPIAFYMTVGDEPEYIAPQEEFYSLVKAKSGQSITIEHVRMGAENHASIPYLSLFNGLRFVFSDWRLPEDVFNQGLAAIDAYYQEIMNKYGLAAIVPENVLNRLGYTLLGNGDVGKAIEVLAENTRRYPQSPNVYDSLGDAYRSAEQLEMARDSYARAYELGRAQNHVNTAIFKANLESVSGD